MEYKEWKEDIIGELTEYIIDYRGKTPKKSPVGVPTLSAKSVKNNWIDYSEAYYISEEEYKRFMVRGFPKVGDVLLTMEAPLGLVATLDRNDVGLAQRIVTMSGKKGTLDNRYFKYYLQSPIGQHELLSRATGTTVVGISQKNLRNVKIKFPRYSTQLKIANILEQYEKKIEINNKIISNLEAQAQAIFKYYFVDFEPFADGNFIDSDIGPIPEGWDVKKIGDLIDFDIGGGWGKENPDEKHTDPAFVIRGADLDGIKNGSFNKDNYRYHKANNYEKRKLEEGDIIFESSGGSPTQVLGRLLYINDKVLDAYNDNVICASFCKLIRIKDKVLGWYIFNILNYAYNNKALVKYEVQSTGLANFAFTIFKEDYNIIVPSRINLERFYRNTFSFMNYSANLSVQNRMLAQTRDALLPKLMAGEIDLDKLGGAYD